MKFVLSMTLAATVFAASIALLFGHTPHARAGIAFPGSPTATHTGVPTRTPTTIASRPPPVATATAGPPQPLPPPTRPGAASGAAMFHAECTSFASNGVRATFLWTPSRAGAQFVDLSTYNNGFEYGSYISVGPLAPPVWGYIWDGLEEGSTHFARVTTYAASGLVSSETFAFYTPICNGFDEPLPGPDMLQLQDSIAAAIANSSIPIDTAVAITDLRTNETIDVNGNATRLPGCTINLYGLMRVALDLQDYKYPEPEPGDLIGQTINRSDPVTARQLMRDWVGGGDLTTGIIRDNDFMHALGMTSTLLDHPPAFPEESLYDVDENRITARDANRGLAALWQGRVLAPFWRDYMLSKMTLVKPGLNYLIPIGTSEGATVSHKNGFLYQEGWADNDVGIVWYERGGERYGYAISFFTENVVNKYDDIPLGQEISSLAYQWFVGRYGYP